jgi:hypothetical protein
VTKIDRPTFIIHLRPEPGIDAIRALRAALKSLLRSFGLRCTHISEIPSPASADNRQGISPRKTTPLKEAKRYDFRY